MALSWTHILAGIGVGSQLIGGWQGYRANVDASRRAAAEAMFQTGQVRLQIGAIDLQSRQGEINAQLAEIAGHDRVQSRLRMLNQDMGAVRVAGFASGFAGPGSANVLRRTYDLAMEDVEAITFETNIAASQARAAGYAASFGAATRAASTAAGASQTFSRAAQLRGAATQSLLQGIGGGLRGLASLAA